MLTGRGWAVAAVGVAALALARFFGAIEFYILGTTLLALVLLSSIHLKLIALEVSATRSIHPRRSHVGSTSYVEIQVHNSKKRRTPVLTLHDRVSGTRGAALTVDSIKPSSTAITAYRLPTQRRGLLTIGPLIARVTGPLGITETSRVICGEDKHIVFPRVDKIRPVDLAAGSDPMAGAIHPNTPGHGGEDFYALRRYVTGDDLRRVHWPSTARHDELMVRQDELPWQGRTTVFVDLRVKATTPSSLELIISAAASIVSANATRQDLVRLICTNGFDSGFAAGHAHVTSILEYLAQVRASDIDGLHRVIDRLTRTATGGALVAVVAEIPDEDLDQIVQLKEKFGSTTLVRFHHSGLGGSDETPPMATGKKGLGSDSTIRVTDSNTFAQAWNTSVPTAGQRRVRTEPMELRN